MYEEEKGTGAHEPFIKQKQNHTRNGRHDALCVNWQALLFFSLRAGAIYQTALHVHPQNK